MMEFGHIRRMQDARFPHEVAVIMPGEYFVSQDPMIVYTVLGSCVSVCIRDTVLEIGGMNHFMLATPTGGAAPDRWGTSARYGNFAMEVLVNEILKRGGRRNRLEVKVFGGGRICEGVSNIGAQNVAWVLDYLEQEGLCPVKADVGDIFPRKVYYFTESGRVLLKKLDRVEHLAIAEDEQVYHSTLARKISKGDVTLF